jgi:hypothetical protein
MICAICGADETKPCGHIPWPEDQKKYWTPLNSGDPDERPCAAHSRKNCACMKNDRMTPASLAAIRLQMRPAPSATTKSESKE